MFYRIWYRNKVLQPINKIRSNKKFCYFLFSKFTGKTILLETFLKRQNPSKPAYLRKIKQVKKFEAIILLIDTLNSHCKSGNVVIPL